MSVVVAGRVLAQSSKRGIEDVVVAAVLTERGATGRRLGSAATDATGAFAIELTLPAEADSVEIVLIVSSPESAGGATTLLSTSPRTVSSGREAYLLWIDDEALRKAGVARPADAEAATVEPDDVLARAAGEASKRAALAEGAAAIHAPRVVDQRQRSAAARVAVESGLRAELGTARPGRGRVAAAGTDLTGPLADAIRDGITNVRAGRPATLRLTITDEQLDALRAGPGSPELDRDRVEALAFAGGARARVREDAIARWCAQLTRGLPVVDALAATPPPAQVTEAPVDLDRALTTIVDEIARRTAPLLAARTDETSLRDRLQTLELAAGPADRAAFFDYGVLLGTIDGVWQELLDEHVLETATDLHEAIADAGGRPAPASGPLRAHLAHEARALHLAGTPDARLRLRPPILGQIPAVPAHQLLSIVFGQRPRDQDHRDEPPRVIHPPVVGGSPPPPTEPPTPEYASLITELETRLEEPYAFQVFAADGDTRAIDFGLFVTYRQRWQPQGHQAGALIKTTTLAPREERTYTTRTTYKRATSAVHATTVEHQRRSESQDVMKSATEIVAAAKQGLGFEVATTGGVEVGELVSGDVTTTTSRTSERSSQESRQLVREAVRRAAQEAKESTRVEVTTSESLETFREETGKLVNANEELPVTYLFYELQRRFRVSERLHQMVPVVMVARQVPPPDRITRGWLFVHGAVLARALLDAQLQPALAYLLNEAAGMEARLGQQWVHLQTQRDLVSSLQEQVDVLAKQTASRYGAVTAAFATLIAAQRAEDREGFAEKAFETVLGGGGSVDAARLREEMAKEAYAQAASNERDARERLGQAVSALEAANQAYVETLAAFRDRELAVRRLRVHVKQHILHYLRAIWNAEDRDQRFFELHSVRVPRLAGHLDYRVVADPQALPIPPHWRPPVTIEATLVPDNVDPHADTVPLGAVADLDRPLGYKGNFMVFPLREHNLLTRFLALPYLDDRAGACDPDLLANYTLSELDQYVACARAALSQEDLAALLPRIHPLYQALLDRPFPDEEELVVPTGSTFIEALPGTRPVLEDFRLLHRALDVSKVAADVRHRELENLRRVARLRDGRLADPDIESVVVAPAGAGVTVASPGSSSSSNGEPA